MEQSVPILLVDDDNRNLLVLETILNAPDYKILKASDAAQTLGILMQEDCAVIVMDVRMPDMSGIELAGLIKQRRKTQHIPILFLTAHHDDEENIIMGYGVGAVDYITKPVNPSILRSKIGVFVDLYRKSADLARLNAAMKIEIEDRKKAEAALLASNGELALKNEELERSADERARRIRAEAARAEAEAANVAKDRFLAMLSHELRTPLSPVLHAVALLEEEHDCSPDVSELLETIRRNVQLESRLIDDLLDLARIKSGKLQLHPEVADVHDLITRAAKICEPDIRKQRLSLRMNLKAHRICLRADPARILQIFWNLINNAIKYTAAGGTITLTTSDIESAGIVEIEIADTGIGIPRERLGTIFGAFEQGHNGASIGLGLGLAISRVLAEMHGGSIAAHSAGPGAGSVFTVSLPGIAGKPDNEKRSAPAEPALSFHLRILLVEDHADTARNLKRLLQRRGYEVETASTVAEACAAMQRAEFDLLLTDIGLPDGQGRDLMAPFKAAARGRTVCGIALSGYGMPEDIRRSMDAGFDHHLTKPVEIVQLQRVLLSIGETMAANGGLVTA